MLIFSFSNPSQYLAAILKYTKVTFSIFISTFFLNVNIPLVLDENIDHDYDQNYHFPHCGINKDFFHWWWGASTSWARVSGPMAHCEDLNKEPP